METSQQKTKYFDLERLRAIRITTVLDLKYTGRIIKIRCPIHNERSASMVIYPDNSFHCYGCSAHGNNAIDLLMAMDASFIEAVAELDKYK